MPRNNRNNRSNAQPSLLNFFLGGVANAIERGAGADPVSQINKAVRNYTGINGEKFYVARDRIVEKLNLLESRDVKKYVEKKLKKISKNPYFRNENKDYNNYEIAIYLLHEKEIEALSSLVYQKIKSGDDFNIDEMVKENIKLRGSKSFIDTQSFRNVILQRALGKNNLGEELLGTASVELHYLHSK